jgi:hypothetical protein
MALPHLAAASRLGGLAPDLGGGISEIAIKDR